MNVRRGSRFQKPELDIAPLVFFAYTDITAAASRALFGLEAKDCQYQTLNIPCLEGASPACIHGPQTKITKFSPPMDPVQVISCRYAEKYKPQVSCIIVNTHVPSEKCHHVAKAILELCSKRHVMKLVVLTSQRMDVDQRSKLFENSFNGMPPLTGRSRLPDDTILTDAFLSNLIQLCTIEGQPFTVVIAPAHRCASGQANKEDGTLQLIRLFQNTLMDCSGVMFQEKISTSLMYRDSSDDAHSGLMYG